MATRTARLDEEAEQVLQQIVQTTGWSMSATFKRGILALRENLSQQHQKMPYEVYQELDLGPGGYAIAPSTDTRRGVQAALRRKLKR